MNEEMVETYLKDVMSEDQELSEAAMGFMVNLTALDLTKEVLDLIENSGL